MVELWIALLCYGGGWIDDLKLVIARGVRRLFGWYREGKLQPRVDLTFAFAEAAAAHRYIQGRRSLGKVVLTPE